LRAYRVFIDGDCRGKIARGETRTFEVEPGRHEVSGQPAAGRTRRREVEVMTMRSAVVLLTLALLACGSEPPPDDDPFAAPQAIVESIVAKHPDLVRLTIHAVPTGETESRIIACNVAAKRGKPSDPEDLLAMKTLETVVLREGDNLDVTAPILDPDGRAIAATGITLSFTEGATEEALVEKAHAIARELTEAIRSAEGPLW
jgi:hypothetical protein